MGVFFYQFKMFLLIIYLASVFLARPTICQIVRCSETEKQSLLRLKRDLIDQDNRLSSWGVEQDCCEWFGVACNNNNNSTGHVEQLNLGEARIKGKINPSMLDLKHLTRLDLSNNDFSGSPIPSFIGSLVTLRYLNLSFAGFEGLIPYQLGNLSSLYYLSLSGPGFYSHVNNLHWLTGLSSLQYLDMSGVNLAKASDHWFLSINTLNSLVSLRFSHCGIVETPFSFVNNLTSLVTLDISHNSLSSSSSSWLIKWLHSLDKLISIDLSRTELGDNGSLVLCSGLKNMTLLETIDLSENEFNSSIPTCLYRFSKLKHIALSDTKLQGVISSDVKNLTSIVTLDLSINALQGKIPQSLRSLCALEFLGLGDNRFTGNISEAFTSLLGCNPNTIKSLNLARNLFSGQITDQIGEFKNLVNLILGENMLSGPIPASLGSLLNLEQLDISYNNFKGVVSEVHLTNLKNLRVLYASQNPLSLRVNPDWSPAFQLETIELRSWDLGPQFPMWLESQKGFINMDLSSTGISDSFPSWFWNLSTQFQYLNLSHNQIHGKIPYINVSASFCGVFLGFNMLDGELPRISPSVTELDLSNNYFSGGLSHFLCSNNQANRLKLLLLGENPLSEKIPDCWMHWPSLEVVKMINANLNGEIPRSMGSLLNLHSLNLCHNNLAGEIPSSLQNCTVLRTLVFALNRLEGEIPKWIGTSLSQLMILGLRGNKFRGKIPSELCQLTRLQILDASQNNLSGTIPRCFNNFTAMTTKPNSSLSIFYSKDPGEFVENAFLVTRGRQEQYSTILRLMVTLDLSGNNLSGEIPGELTSLRGLFSLNLSGNHFRGRIPSTIEWLSWAQCLDFSRNELTGNIPPTVSNMNFITIFNVSHNDLSGEIPTSTQLQRMDASNFLGNQFLCGPPLNKACKLSSNEASYNEKDVQEEEEEEEEEEDYWYWFRLGIGVGFLGVISPLLIYPPWRHC